MGQREDLYKASCKITGTDGKTVSFDMDKFDGGEVTSKETKYRTGNGTVDQQSLGGATEVSNITVTALMTYPMYQQLTWLMQQTGKATMYVYKQPLDVNGAAFGNPLVYKGVLTGVNPPKTDSESDAAGLLALTQSTVTPVTSGS